jgi:hypothetical protein
VAPLPQLEQRAGQPPHPGGRSQAGRATVRSPAGAARHGAGQGSEAVGATRGGDTKDSGARQREIPLGSPTAYVKEGDPGKDTRAICAFGRPDSAIIKWVTTVARTLLNIAAWIYKRGCATFSSEKGQGSYEFRINCSH